MVVTGTGSMIPEAQDRAYALADRVFVPNLRYRRDVGDKLVAGDYAAVERLGLLGED
jgi:phosphoribosylamine--glycine ligase